MELNNLLFNYIKQIIPNETLDLNSIFEGEIVNVEGDNVYVNIPGKGLVKAESEVDLEKLMGKTIKFIVNSKKDGLIEIKPMIDKDGNPVDKRETTDTISKVLKEFNIKEDDGTKRVVSNLIKHDVPIKRDVIQDAIRTYDKLIELTNLEEDDQLELIEPKRMMSSKEVTESLNSKETGSNFKINENLIDGTVAKENVENTVKDSLGKEIAEILDGFKDELPIEKEIKTDIRKFILSDKTSLESINLKKSVETMLKDFDFSLKEDEFVEIVSFLTKNKMKPSLNNIKFLKEVLDDPFEFMEETKELMEKVKIEIIDRKKPGEISLEDSQEEKELGKTIKNSELEKKDLPKLKLNDKKDLIELRNKSEFLRDLNKDMLFHFIPINYGEKNLDGLVNFLKEKEKKKIGKEKTNIFINLRTHNLGRIKISCQAKKDVLNVVIGIRKEDELIFKTSKPILIDRIEMLGYDVQNIKFILSEDFKLSEEIVSNSDPMHFLDIKV